MTLKPFLQQMTATLRGLANRRTPMPTVIVTKIDTSKNGKPRVYFENKHNWQDSYYIGNKCNGIPTVGQQIEADTSQVTFPNAKGPTWFLNSWKPVQAQQVAQQMTQGQQIQTPAINGTYTPKPVMGWPDVPTGDLSRFVSNIVGQAITAGLIKAPTDIAPWVAAAYRGAEDMRSGKVKDFDAPIPQFVHPDDPGPDPAEDHGYDDDSVPF